MIHVHIRTDQGASLYKEKHRCAVLLMHKPEGIWFMVNKTAIHGAIRVEMKVEQGYEPTLDIIVSMENAAAMVRTFKIVAQVFIKP